MQKLTGLSRTRHKVIKFGGEFSIKEDSKKGSRIDLILKEYIV